MASVDPRRRPAQTAPPPPPPPPPVEQPEVVQAQESFTPPGSPPRAPEDDSFKLKFCTVCASNNNRSGPAVLITAPTNCRVQIHGSPPSTSLTFLSCNILWNRFTSPSPRSIHRK